MKKTQIFENMHLSIEGLRRIDACLTGPGGIFEKPHHKWFSIGFPGGPDWEFDVAEQFLGEYRPGLSAAYTRGYYGGGTELHIFNYASHDHLYSKVVVRAADKATVQAVFDAIEGQPCIRFVMPPKKRRVCRQRATAKRSSNVCRAQTPGRSKRRAA